MTENKENRVSQPKPNGAAGNMDTVADETVAEVPQEEKSQVKHFGNGLMSEGMRRIIISAAQSKQGHRTSPVVLIGLGVAIVVFVFFQIMNRHGGKASPVRVLAKPNIHLQKPLVLADNNAIQKDTAETTEREPSKQIPIDIQTEDTLDQAVSLQTAQLLYQRGDYENAYYVYDELRANISGSELKQQCLRDWLSLQMALSLQRTDNQTHMGELFTEALRSRSLVVRAMASYHLAIIQFHHQQFYESRNRAYQALALLKSFEKQMPTTMEADCYFIAAESLTRQVLKMNGLNGGLPGAFWSASMEPYSLPIVNQAQLSELLMVGMGKMNDAVLMPKVEFFPNREVGAQWSVLCRDVPLEQLFWGFASEADLVVSWDNEPSKRRSLPVTVYLPYVDRLYLAEVISANAGLIWQYDGQKGIIYDPANYRDFGELRHVLVKEAISMWQRFLLRYRNNQRIPNAQFCLGRLYAIADEAPMALGSYKLLTTQFDNDDLAPYALLEISAIKIEMKDYAGAREDLNELLIQYPDCMVADKALLSLAEMTRIGGLYQDAAKLYEQIVSLNINEESRVTALLGLVQCAYEYSDHQASVKWFSQAMQAISDKSDSRLGSVCLMAGRSYIQLKEYEKASAVFRIALGSLLDSHEYVQIALELVHAECMRDNYLQALTILENVPEEKLNQEDSCQLLISKSNIYRAIDLPDIAITLLRRRIELIARASLRARLTVELAECYMLNNDLRIAQKELENAIYDLPAGYDTQRCSCLLARIACQQGEFKKAQTLCLGTLQTRVEDESLRTEILELLGNIYMKQRDYENASLAFAGALDQDVVQ